MYKHIPEKDVLSHVDVCIGKRMYGKLEPSLSD
jgi:hypothetical protein